MEAQSLDWLSSVVEYLNVNSKVPFGCIELGSEFGILEFGPEFRRLEGCRN
jgi:hypothetical protein